MLKVCPVIVPLAVSETEKAIGLNLYCFRYARKPLNLH